MMMDALIAELQAATKGSRELDEAINRLVEPDQWTIRNSPFSWPAYTTSLDASLTLVPEGLEWSVSNKPQIGCPDTWGWAGVFGGAFVGSENDTNAATPALAMCIASLRARQAMKGAE